MFTGNSKKRILKVYIKLLLIDYFISNRSGFAKVQSIETLLNTHFLIKPLGLSHTCGFNPQAVKIDPYFY